MDKEHGSALEELSIMQLKISRLFFDLVKEKNEHKKNSENLIKKLQQLSKKLEKLKQQNKALKQNNADMKSIIENAIKIFKNLDFTNLNVFKDNIIPLETLKKTFFQFNKKVENSKGIDVTLESSLEEEEKNTEIDKTRYKLSDEEIQKEFEGLSNLNFFTNFSYNEADNTNSPKRDYALDRTRLDSSSKSLFDSTSNAIKISRQFLSDFENDSFHSDSVNTIVDVKTCKLSSLSTEIENRVSASPVFKDFVLRRHDNSSNDENSTNSSTSLKLINEKFLEKSDGFLISPWRKSPRRTQEKTPSKKSPATKRARKRLKINSPERSPIYLLKKSNMREAEISFSGIRKLRQTLLNVDCYRKNNIEARENENCGSLIDSSKKRNKAVMVDEEDDDFITESPKKDDQILDSVKIKKTERDLKVPFITPPQTSDPDLDETYVSSSLVRKCNAKNERELEKVIENQTPLKREKNASSVPYFYKRDPIRKKVDRMKLPGHACFECMKYYENAFDDINTQDFKKVLNKCSRHRDRNSPTLDDTPPGYWKPYVTCSTITSPNKDDVCEAVIN